MQQILEAKSAKDIMGLTNVIKKAVNLANLPTRVLSDKSEKLLISHLKYDGRLDGGVSSNFYYSAL